MKNMCVKNIYGRRTTKSATKSEPSPLDRTLAEIREYNKAHGTALSYGQYFARQYKIKAAV